MKVKDLIESLSKFSPEAEINFAQANGDINMWCNKAAVQLEHNEKNSPVEIIIIQEW